MPSQPKSDAKLSAALGAVLAMLATGNVLAMLATGNPAAADEITGLADLLDRVKPSVVGISATLPVPAQTAPADPQNNANATGPKPEPAPAAPTSRPGSGIVFSRDGHVVTAIDVIDGATDIFVISHTGRNEPADVVGKDARTSIALLRVRGGADLAPADFGESTAVRAGQPYFSVSNPHGLLNSVARGTIAAVGRDIGQGPFDYFQIDRGVLPGSAGGALFDSTGKVIGMLMQTKSTGAATGPGVGFALPSHSIVGVAEQLRSSGSVARGWLGVKIQNVTDDVAKTNGLTGNAGALIAELTPGGPAERAGLKPGQIILAVGPRDINDSRDLARAVAEYAPGTDVDFKVQGDGQTRSIRVSLGRFPDQVATASPATPSTAGTSTTSAAAPNENLDRLGLSVGAPANGRRGAAITTVKSDSEAARKGLKIGDTILEIGGQRVEVAGDAESMIATAVAAGRATILLRVRSGGEVRSVDLNP